MISIRPVGTSIEVRIDIPSRLTGGERRYLATASDLGGSAAAVAALAEDLRVELSAGISAIRREAYEQGARDRAKKAISFSGSLATGLWRGGCVP